MQFTKQILLISALAALGFAQDSSSCDPQNDSNDNSTCTSAVVIAASTTSSLASRISLVSSTDTNVIFATNLNTVVMTTSLPHSLDTRTSTYLNTIVVTGESAYTTNTLGDASSAAITTNTVTRVASSSTMSTSSGLAAAATAGFMVPMGVAVAALGFAAGL